MSHALTLAQFPVPSTAGSIEAYIQAANRVPMLAEGEEFELARRFHSEGDLEAARRLVLSHLRLVIAVARGYLGYGLPHADLIQEGNIGLMKAVKRFDPDRGVRLVSFAMHWIKAEIHEYILKNWRLVKIATTKAQRKLFFNLRSLKQSLHALTLQEADSVARELNVSRKDVLEMETRLSGHDVSIDPTVDDGEEGYSPLAYMASPDENPAQRLEREQTERLRHTGLTHALENLDERSRHIIQARWLTEGEAATLHELAAQYGVSAERIRQIEARALQKMRAAMPA
jgi:RNA polymerase sigma-32 factor